MKKYLINISLFTIPFILYFFIILSVDPFNYFNISKIISYDLKNEISNKTHYQLWKILDFENNPSPNIVLGDSRAARLTSELLLELTGKEYKNLAYGGGYLKEAIETFWLADEKVKLKNVYMGVNFNLYSDNELRNLVQDVKSIKKNPFNYVFNKITFKALYRILYSLITNNEKDYEKPQMNKEDFWKYQLTTTTKRYYSNYKYPEKLYREMQNIAEYCNINEIKLVIFIAPTHTDLQEEINKYDLYTDYKKFLYDMISLNVTVFNFNIKNEFNKDTAMYGDPFHLYDYTPIVKELFLETDSLEYGEIISYAKNY